MINSIIYFLTVNVILFFTGVLGIVLNRRNIIITIVSIEIILLASNLNFAIFSIYLDDIVGEIFVLFILTVAAAESAIGLSILTAYYKITGTVNLDKIKEIKN